MPRFFLHIDDGTQRIEDEEGSDLPDLAAAREEALGAARQLWAAAILAGQDIAACRFVITNGDGNVMDTVDMDEALPEKLARRLRL
ncbi:DUF6894 family protein [Sphingomonas sp. NFX23]|uniref:DUF6894 family protein n=1 Tax=Sphingomonas sp. NFX23 TaxID=2819532 RepID=UPI003CF380AF